MNVTFRHAWMQKHPSPTRTSGDFHWHPAGIAESTRGTLTDLANRTRGQQASLWIIDESCVAWARAFSAVSPADARRYTGLAVTIAEPSARGAGAWSAALPEVLARLPLPPAGPYAGTPEPSGARIEDAPGATRPLAIDPESLGRLFEPDHALAAAVYRGGQVFSHDAHAERLPAMLGRLISWLPPGERARPRTGVFAGSRAGVEQPGQPGSGLPLDNLLHYLSAAWYCPAAIRARAPGFATGAWQLVLDLGAALGCELHALFADLTRVASAWDTAANLRRHLLESGVLAAADIAACDQRAPAPLYGPAVEDAGWLWNRLLHYWGRGFVPATALPSLAGLLARRITADHLFHLDAPDQPALPRRYLRRLAYEALLPRDHVAAMMSAVKRFLPSLSDDPAGWPGFWPGARTGRDARGSATEVQLG